MIARRSFARAPSANLIAKQQRQFIERGRAFTLRIFITRGLGTSQFICDKPHVFFGKRFRHGVGLDCCDKEVKVGRAFLLALFASSRYASVAGSAFLTNGACVLAAFAQVAAWPIRTTGIRGCSTTGAVEGAGRGATTRLEMIPIEAPRCCCCCAARRKSCSRPTSRPSLACAAAGRGGAAREALRPAARVCVLLLRSVFA